MVESTAAKIPYYFTFYFAAIVLLIPRWPGVYGQLQPDTNAIPLLILCGLALVMLCFIGELRLFLPTRNILFLLVANICIMSLFRSDLLQDVRQAASVLLTSVVVVFLTTLLHSIRVRSALWLCTWNMTAAVSLSSLIHLQRVGEMTFFDHNSRTRVSGLFYYADNAMMLSLSIMFSVLVLMFSKKKSKALQATLVNVIICSVLLASTDTRSVMIALVLSLFFILVFSQVRLGVKIILISCGIIMLVASYFFFDPAGEESSEKVMVRQMIWEVAIDGIKERPITGYGDERKFFQSDYEAGKIAKTLQDAHNAHLMHMLTFGVPSWILLLWLLMNVAWNGLRHFTYEFHCLHSIILFWLMASFFWGRTFLLDANVNHIMFMVSLLGIVSHPDVYRDSMSHKHDYLYKISL